MGLYKKEKKWLQISFLDFFAVSLLVTTPSVFARRYERLRGVCKRKKKQQAPYARRLPLGHTKPHEAAEVRKHRGVGEDKEEERTEERKGWMAGFTGQCPLLTKTDGVSAPGWTRNALWLLL